MKMCIDTCKLHIRSWGWVYEGTGDGGRDWGWGKGTGDGGRGLGMGEGEETCPILIPEILEMSMNEAFIWLSRHHIIDR